MITGQAANKKAYVVRTYGDYKGSKVGTIAFEARINRLSKDVFWNNKNMPEYTIFIPKTLGFGTGTSAPASELFWTLEEAEKEHPGLIGNSFKQKLRIPLDLLI